jgi:hypothetical protein
MSRLSLPDHEALSQELQGLARLSRHSLVERWTALYGSAPPPRTSRSLLIRAVAYRLQERALGGLKPAICRALAGEGSALVANRTRALRPGTVLLREWQGATHQVTIIEDGVLFRGKCHRSLSAVARLITGQVWSGPLFFGLKAMNG